MKPAFSSGLRRRLAPTARERGSAATGAERDHRGKCWPLLPCCQVRALPAPPLPAAVGREAGASRWGLQAPLPAELPLGGARGSRDLCGGHSERGLLARRDARTRRLTGCPFRLGPTRPAPPLLSQTRPCSWRAPESRALGSLLAGGARDPAGRS